MRPLILITACLAAGLHMLPAAAETPAAAPADDHTLSAEGDAAQGKRIFNRCRACHNLSGDSRPRTGPNLDHLFGRTAGTSESYGRYSSALKDANFVWTEERLDEWLANPRSFLPGNKMAFPGVRKEQERKDLIAYLRQATTSGEE